MRRALCALMMTLILPLSACGGVNEDDALALKIRSHYLELTGLEGHAAMSADYGRRVYDYEMDFCWEPEGETVFTLTAPENVAGVTARIASGETALEFDGVTVETGALTPDGLTPMSAIPAVMTTIREGFLSECALEENGPDPLLRMVCRDPEQPPGTGQETYLWFDPETAALKRAELSCDGSVVLFCQFTGLTMTGPSPKE